MLTCSIGLLDRPLQGILLPSTRVLGLSTSIQALTVSYVCTKDIFVGTLLALSAIGVKKEDVLAEFTFLHYIIRTSAS